MIRSHFARCLATWAGGVVVLALVPRVEAQLEEVIVTAQKREQRLQDVPMAVTAVSRELIENNEVNSIEDLAKVVPSLRLTPDGNTNGGSINMRGIGTNVFSIAVEPNVSVMVDGVVLSRNSLASFDFADIERIEVLRGPQGTLFGKNASAGLLHVLTRDPVDEFEARIRYSYEQPEEFPGDFMKTQFTVSGPLADGLGLRVTGYHKQVNGHLEDIELNEKNPESEQFGVRSKLRWDPTDTLTLRLNLEYSELEGVATGVPFRDANPTLRERLAPIEPSEENREMRTLGGNISDMRNGGASLSVDWDFDTFVLTSVTGYRDAEQTNGQSIAGLEGQRIDLRTNISRYDIETFTQELRITSGNNDLLEYTAGVLWFENEISEDFYRNIEDLPAGFIANTIFPGLLPPGLGDSLGGADSFSNEASRFSVVNTRNVGIFAEGTWHITDAWHLTAGARYINEEVDVILANSTRTANSATGEEIAGSEFPLSDATVSDTTGTGRISLLHDLVEDVTVYATVSTGYRGAAFDVIADDAASALADPVAPEKALSYELGFKSRLFDSRLDLNVTAFLTYFEDFQAQVRDLTNPASVVSFRLDNAGELETSGLEVEFHAKPTASLSFIGSFLYNRARYNEFFTQCFFGQQPGEAGGMDHDGDGVCDEQDAAGGVLANAPEYSASLTTRYEHEFDSGHALYALLSGRWQDEVQFSNEQHPNTIEEAYSIWNLRLGWLGPAEQFEVAAYVKNLFAQHYVHLITPLSLVNDRRDVVHNIPTDADRIFGVSLAYRW